MAELREAYNAINSVLNNTRIAIVFLDKDLRVSRFTPEATQILNLIDSDVGRPMDHITHNLECSDLAGRVRGVLKELSPVDEEVRDHDGHWYRMRIMVYRPEEPVIEGVVLTFINIDAQKEAQEELREMSERSVRSARQYAESIVDTVREGLLVLDEAMRVVTANRSFYRTFGTTPEETEGRPLFELQGGGWDTPELRSLLRETLERERTFEGYRLEGDFPEVGARRLVLNARTLRDDREERRVLLAVEDRTGNGKEAS
jgi:two-component system CheB/CheR fusion protein